MENPTDSNPTPNQPHDQTDTTNQPASNSPEPSVNTPNYLPASPQFMSEMEQRNSSPQATADANSTSTTSPTADSLSNQPIIDMPDLTPPTDQVDFNLPPIGQQPDPLASDPTTSSLGNSFRPPQEVIDGLTDDQKRFINGASWGPLLSLPFLIANNSLKHSLIMYVASLIPLVNIAMVTVYVIHGRRIAWQSHYWDSFESYHRNMSKWSKWSKIYLAVVAGLMLIGIAAAISLIFINPQERLNEADDSSRKSLVMQVSSASEKCFTEQATGDYSNCDNIVKLQTGGYLASNSANLNPANVVITQDPSSKSIIIYTTLQSATTTCDEGSGQPAYFVYDSSTGHTKTTCGRRPDSRLDTATPTPTASPSPSRNRTTPTVNYSR